MADDSVTEALAATSLADPSAASGEAPPADGEQVVTPWDVQGGAGGIDYDKLLSTFGCQPINADLIARCVWLASALCVGASAEHSSCRSIERATGVKPHVLLRRGMFFAHRHVLSRRVSRAVLTSGPVGDRDLTQLLDAYEKDPRSFYLYTGRARALQGKGCSHLQR